MPTGKTTSSVNRPGASPTDPARSTNPSAKKFAYLKNPRIPRFTTIDVASRARRVGCGRSPSSRTGNRIVDDGRHQQQTQETPVPHAVEEVRRREQDRIPPTRCRSPMQDEHGHEEQEELDRIEEHGQTRAGRSAGIGARIAAAAARRSHPTGGAHEDLTRSLPGDEGAHVPLKVALPGPFSRKLVMPVTASSVWKEATNSRFSIASASSSETWRPSMIDFLQ